MNTINYQLALKWIFGLGVAWLISLGLIANVAGIAGVLILGFAMALAQRLALDLEQDFGYLGLITFCWAISYFIADFATKASFSMNGKIGEIVLFGILGGATSSAIMALRFSTNSKRQTLWTASFVLTGILAGGVSMWLYWLFTEVLINSKELWFLKDLAGIMTSGMMYGLITFIPLHFISLSASKEEAVKRLDLLHKCAIIGT